MDIELKLLDPRLTEWGFPFWGSALAAGLDLFACLAAPLTLPPKSAAILIPAGFAMRINDARWAALIYPRSGQGHKRGLILGNTVGVIDADYEGEVLISAWNRNAEEAITVAPGERIAQMVLTRITRPEFTVVQQFSGSSVRGIGGYGSTG